MTDWETKQEFHSIRLFVSAASMDRKAPKQSYEERVGSALWGCSDIDFPVAVARLEDHVAKKFPDRRHLRRIGLTQSLAPTRQAFIKKCISEDAGSTQETPDSNEF